MARRNDDPPDGLPPTCVAPTFGRNFALFRCTHHGGPLGLLPNGNSNHPPQFGEPKCDLCEQPGVKCVDQHWVCENCGQRLLDALQEELDRPAPKRYRKTIRPGQRGREKRK
jgi:hypothetical protein